MLFVRIIQISHPIFMLMEHDHPYQSSNLEFWGVF